MVYHLNKFLIVRHLNLESLIAFEVTIHIDCLFIIADQQLPKRLIVNGLAGARFFPSVQ